jgi:amino acid adenylation domain-containing protein
MNRYPGAVPLLHDLLLAAAAARPDQVALVAAGARLTYATIDQRSNALAHALIGRGVAPRDRVVVIGENTVDSALAFWAALKASAVPVMVSPQTRADKLRYLIGDCRPTALVADSALGSVVAAALVDAPPPRAVFTSGGAASGLAGSLALDEAIAGERAERPPERRVIDLDLATIIYTSGSTGDPKGVMHTHRSMRAAAASIGAYLEIGRDEVILDVLPLSFDYGLYQMIMAFAAGARLVLERSFAFPGRILTRIGEEQVTGFPGVPTMFAIIAAMKDLSGFDLSPVRYVTNTAAALGGKHIAAIRRGFPHARIYSMYGLTECKRVSYLPPEDLERKPTSVGLPIPNTEVWIAGDDGSRLGPGQIGEIVVRGATVMRGYWEKPRETAIKLRPGPLPGEQVLFTGDLGMQDEEGYLYFVARKDDVIKSRGEKVAPREVEDALLAIAGIHEAAVIGVADEILGQAPAAFVVLEPGVSLTVAEILRACRDRLESHMVPKYVELVADLPRTATGKIRKTGLAAARAAERSGGEEA